MHFQIGAVYRVLDQNDLRGSVRILDTFSSDGKCMWIGKIVTDSYIGAAEVHSDGSVFGLRNSKEVAYVIIPHPHAEAMAQYARDATRTLRPYKLWQYKTSSSSWWIPLTAHPAWLEDTVYRRIGATDT